MDGSSFRAVDSSRRVLPYVSPPLNSFYLLLTELQPCFDSMDDDLDLLHPTLLPIPTKLSVHVSFLDISPNLRSLSIDRWFAFLPHQGALHLSELVRAGWPSASSLGR